MREYGQVQSAFWQSHDAQQWTDTGKLLALYLLTGPHSNGVGCFRLPNGYVMADLGWTTQAVEKGFEELSANGFANRFDNVVFMPNFLRWNRIANNNIAKARLTELEALPKGTAKALAARALLDFCEHWDGAQETVLETVCQTLPEGYANQNPTQPNPERTQSCALPDRFDEFWAAYPEKKGKAEARRAWKRKGLDAMADDIIRDVQARLAGDRQWLEGYIPHGSTYVNKSGWEDAITPPRPSRNGAGGSVSAGDYAL